MHRQVIEVLPGWAGRAAVDHCYDVACDDPDRPVRAGRRQRLKGRSERRVDALGLVTKQNVWYLLADTDSGRRSFRLDRMWSVELTDERFEYPDDFDLGAAWNDITTKYTERSSRVSCGAIGEPWVLPALRALGVETVVAGEHDDGRFDLTIASWSAEVLAAKVAGVIAGLELVDPPVGVVARLGQIGAHLVSRFETVAER